MVEGDGVRQPERIAQRGYGLAWTGQDAHGAPSRMAEPHLPAVGVEGPHPRIGDPVEDEEPAQILPFIHL